MNQENINLDLMKKLASYGLLQSLAKQDAEMIFVDEFKIKNYPESMNPEKIINFLKEELNIKDDEKLELWKKQALLSNNSQFLDFARLRYKRSLVIKDLMSTSGESLFLKYKDRLDRVLYSLIRVKDEDEANDLYFSIESKEAEFGDIAEKFSCGPESKTRGIVGPVDFTTPHPEVASRLRTCKPGELISPFKASEWFAIIRLEYRYESEYDDKTKSFLGSLILGSKSKGKSQEIMQQFADLVGDK